MRIITIVASLFVVAIIVTLSIAIFGLYFFRLSAVPQSVPSGHHFTFDDSLSPRMRGELSDAMTGSPQFQRLLDGQEDAFLSPTQESSAGNTVGNAATAPAPASQEAPSAREPADAQSRNGVRTLSADPLGDVPENRARYVVDRSRRPAWANLLPRYDDEVATVSVASGPCATQRLALEQLDAEIMRAVSTYAERQFGMPNEPANLGFTIDEIRSRCLRGEPYVEHGELTGIGPMTELFARLEFDAEFRRELGERWRSLTVLGRLVRIGYTGGGVLLLVAMARFVLGKPSTPSEPAPVALASANAASPHGPIA